MKSELLVTAGQHTAVNTFPGLALTARHITSSLVLLKSLAEPVRDGGAEGVPR